MRTARSDKGRKTPGAPLAPFALMWSFRRSHPLNPQRIAWVLRPAKDAGLRMTELVLFLYLHPYAFIAFNTVCFAGCSRAPNQFSLAMALDCRTARKRLNSTGMAEMSHCDYSNFSVGSAFKLSRDWLPQRHFTEATVFRRLRDPVSVATDPSQGGTRLCVI